MIHQPGRGDQLASGARSAVFTGPKLRFSEGEMHDDLAKLTRVEFQDKYMITDHEYNMLASATEEKVSSFAEEMKQRAEIADRQLAAEKAQEDTLRRDCFLTPFVPMGYNGRVIVSRDGPADKPSKLLIPKSLRKDKTLLPTTGHVIVETIEVQQDATGHWQRLSLLGKRVLFSPMSGTAICFKNYPTWIQLDLAEILAIVNREDVELQDETLEPMI